MVRIDRPDFVAAAEIGCGTGQYNWTALVSDCPLLARKFPRHLVEKTAQVFERCTFTLKVVDFDGDTAICERPDTGEWVPKIKKRRSGTSA